MRTSFLPISVTSPSPAFFVPSADAGNGRRLSVDSPRATAVEANRLPFGNKESCAQWVNFLYAKASSFS